MATIPENREHWQSLYSWPDDGEEWSAEWGGSDSQWRGSILPRIGHWLPTGTILEIGCGRGRWSGRLRPLCKRLLLVDLVEPCVEACRQKFADDPAVDCALTDGSSLPGVAEGSVDFAFSFDSLVHAELDVLDSYLGELARVLTADGAAFIHHSNMAEILGGEEDVQNLHWRAESVSARLLAETIERRGLSWIRQEIVDWGDVRDGDVFTTLVRPGRAAGRGQKRLWNRHFMGEVRSLAVREELYRAVPLAETPG